MPSRNRQYAALEYLAVCLSLWMLAVILQWQAGAYRAEFASHPDESAHYVTGLMIRDYLASGHFAAPLPYAEQYYLHYPKVALGMWPPFFHGIEALWILIFSPSKVSVLLLMALITALTGASTYYLVRRGYARIAALAAAALYVLAPLTQSSTAAVMADGLVALLDLWATIYFVRYLENERTHDAILFGIFTALSMATKANGVALVLLPVIAIPLTGRWRLLRARGLYYAAAIILLCGAPWSVLSYFMIARSMGGEPVTLPIIAGTALAYLRVLWTTLGPGLAPFGLLGLAVSLVRLRKPPLDPVFAAACPLWFSVWIYHSLIGNGDSRYMLAALPPALTLVVSGFIWLLRILPLAAVPVPARAVVLTAIAILLFATQTWTVPLKPYQGFDQPAHFLLTTPAFANGNFLVISHARGEGAFISEIAMHDHRPGHIVLRSTKVLSSSTWYGTAYQLRYQTGSQIRDFLDQAPIQAIALDTRPPRDGPDEAAFRLQNKVTAALQDDPHWKLLNRYPKLPGISPWIDLYSRVGPQPSGPVRLDLRYTLGRDITAH
jgi:hypothetical protein